MTIAGPPPKSGRWVVPSGLPIYLRASTRTRLRRCAPAIAAAPPVALSRATSPLGQALDLEVASAPGAYICGEETSILESLEGSARRGARVGPALAGSHTGPSADSGNLRSSHVVTLASVPWIMHARAHGHANLSAWQIARHAPHTALGQHPPRGLVEARVRAHPSRARTMAAARRRQTNPRGCRSADPSAPTFPPPSLDTCGPITSARRYGCVLVTAASWCSPDIASTWRAWRAYAMEFCASNPAASVTPGRIARRAGVEVIDRIARV